MDPVGFWHRSWWLREAVWLELQRESVGAWSLQKREIEEQAEAAAAFSYGKTIVAVPQKSTPRLGSRKGLHRDNSGGSPTGKRLRRLEVGIVGVNGARQSRSCTSWITDYVEEGVGRGRGWGVGIAIAISAPVDLDYDGNRDARTDPKQREQEGEGGESESPSPSPP
ncbi:hypothetical protein L1887_20252 [Cichorium endivia]|nr:hypothetical protein L1887_20252 [Cichorium endivia]